MTKEEQLQIYSAYLPYNLYVQLSAKDTYKNGVFPLVGIRYDGLFYMGESGMFGYVQRELQAVKPILYDLSYLTKEIEHEGRKLIVTDVIFPKEDYDSEFERNDAIEALKMEGDIKFCCTSFEIVQVLLKYHFNVFNLSEGEFINKATLHCH